MSKNNLLNILTSFSLITFGALVESFGIKSFLLPNKFIDGGITGISMLIHFTTHIDLGLLIIILNVPFLVFGYFSISRLFVIKSIFAILLLGFFVFFINFPIITNDKLLSAAFGGFFLGAGVGLVVKNGGISDGTELMAVVLGKQLSITMGNIILFLNILIFISASFFLGIDKALYSILAYFSAYKTMDFIIYGIEEYNNVIIISDKSQEIKNMIIHEFKKGVTVYKTYGGFTGSEQESLSCVVTRLEMIKLKKLIFDIDESAFIIVQPISQATGGIIKKHIKA
ncbi:MAG TPA: YitT family protein [Desulfurella acetivorans]|uniref:YitT family protein n=1 Tax=Desulfurella acetivorans TaxID=33002 RepID=A0A7C6E9Z9_DESAE|nr:YitT family protein [Desulfurella acetivorans]